MTHEPQQEKEPTTREILEDLIDLIHNVITDWPQFDTGDEVSGGNAIEWLGSLRVSAIDLFGCPTVDKWKAAVAKGHTTLGYADWLENEADDYAGWLKKCLNVDEELRPPRA